MYTEYLYYIYIYIYIILDIVCIHILIVLTYIGLVYIYPEYEIPYMVSYNSNL